MENTGDGGVQLSAVIQMEGYGNHTTAAGGHFFCKSGTT